MMPAPPRPVIAVIPARRGSKGLAVKNLRMLGGLEKPTSGEILLQGEPIDIGDHVLIHVGYAIQKISEEEARSTWDLFDEILEHA